MRASVSSAASGAGDRRNGRCGSITSRGSPSTKRAAVTFPSSERAARSGRAGVRRGWKASDIEPDPEKWEPVFGKRSCSNNNLKRDDDSKKSHPALAVARRKQRVERARRLALAAFRTAGFCRRRPGVDVDVQPALRRLDEAPQKQRRGDRAGKAAGRYVVEIGDFGIEHRLIGPPQRQAPQRIVLARGAAGKLRREGLVFRVEQRAKPGA